MSSLSLQNATLHKDTIKRGWQLTGSFTFSICIPKANGPEGWVHITRSQLTVHKSWTYYNFRISIMHSLQNLNQTSASRLNLKLKSWPNLASEYWPRFNFVTSTKHQQQNTDQTSASKSRLNFNFKILTKVFSFQICNKLLPTQSSSLTSAVVTNSTSFE